MGDDSQVETTKKHYKVYGTLRSYLLFWIVGINVFCIYGAFVAAGTYFAVSCREDMVQVPLRLPYLLP